jgi:hypothetical protein
MIVRRDEEGDFYQCDRCKINFSIYFDEEYDEGVTPSHWPLLEHLYAKRQKPNVGDFCKKCEREIRPLIFILRDIDEVTTFLNKLKKAINEKRNQGNKNNRSVA